MENITHIDFEVNISPAGPFYYAGNEKVPINFTQNVYLYEGANINIYNKSSFGGLDNYNCLNLHLINNKKSNFSINLIGVVYIKNVNFSCFPENENYFITNQLKYIEFDNCNISFLKHAMEERLIPKKKVVTYNCDFNNFCTSHSIRSRSINHPNWIKNKFDFDY